ncbi:TolB-like translocation protein [Frigoriglobus tundricola]|uniref:Uncharacterized protein n=1 Tax=Frigoriglobus tundricola TaxID=2774151 RepID=A0A6M5YRU3_9BACT|nr:hypothetical protein [Frigoriglobus tundricola]QJW96160.1 hypothetical protein FTUN_3716 [Frigoriglobus tundricola]
MYSLSPRDPDKTPDAGGLAVCDIVTGKSSPVANVPLNARIISVCWSPDGKKLAYSWRITEDRKKENPDLQEVEFHITVCDPDGQNQKTVASEKGQVRSCSIGHVYWR